MTAQIELLGLTIREPMTTFTDYVVAAAATWFACQLIFTAIHKQHRGRRLWGIAFAFIGAGAVLGGTTHGFADYLNEGALSVIWKLTLYTIGLSMVFAVAGTIRPSISRPSLQWILHGINAVGFLLFATQVFGDDSYLNVIIVTVFSLAAIALLQGGAWLAQKSASASWIVSGVAVSVIAALIQRSGFSLHLHFNHNDLYHAVQLLGLYFLYRGASELNDQGSAANHRYPGTRSQIE